MLKKNAIVVCFIVTIMTISALSGCTEKDPIKIGFSGNLTGRSSELGVSGRNGVEIAVDRINKSGGINGRKIQLVIKDDGENLDTSLSADSELYDEGVVAIIGHFISGTQMASLAGLKDKTILYISPTVSSESLTGLDDNFIRVISSNRKQGELLANVAAKKSKSKRIAAVYEWTNRAFSQELFEQFKIRLEELGGEIVYSNKFTSGSENSFVKIAEEMVDSGADGMLVVAGGLDASVLYQHLQRLKPGVPVYSGMWAMTEDFIMNGGKALGNQYIAGILDKDSKKEEYLKFYEDYYSRYKAIPTFSSIYSYDAAMVLFEAIKSSEALTPESVKRSVLNIGYFKGLQDDFYIDRYGDTDRGYYVFSVNEGQFKRVD